MIEKHGSLIYGTEDEIMEAIRKKERQEQCDDAISRQAAIEAVSEGCQEWRGIYGRCEELINELPSVTQKSGKWIEKEGWDGDVYYECSVCGEAFCLIDGTPTDNMYNYCPNCGAKMESEDKE